jgi:hypothetical protein
MFSGDWSTSTHLCQRVTAPLVVLLSMPFRVLGNLMIFEQLAGAEPGSGYGHLLTLQLRLDSLRGADPVTTVLAPGRYYR